MTAGKLPSWICNRLTETDVKHIEEAVAQVEAQTEGEIVPMIVSRSIPREPIQVGVTLSLFLGLVFMIVHQIIPGPDGLNEAVIELIAFAISSLIGFGLARIGFIQDLFVGRDELEGRVYEKAELEFYRARINHTHKQVGILLFLSLAEHRAVVLADRGIAEKLKPEDWLAVVRLMTRAAKENRLGTGMCDAIRECGKVLHQHFPKAEKSTNEIPNRLILRGD